MRVRVFPWKGYRLNRFLSYLSIEAPKAGITLSSWSMNVVAGRPNEHLPCFGSQRSSWGTVSFFLLQQWPPKCSRRIQTMALGVRANSCLIIQSCVSFLALESADKYVCEVSHLSVDSDQWPTLNVRTAWDARSEKQERPPWKKIGGCFQSLSEWITRRP